MKSHLYRLNRRQYLELEKIGLGAFWPVDRFMDERTFKSVVQSMRLPTGDVFPLPIVLDVPDDIVESLSEKDWLELEYLGHRVGAIKAESVYRPDKDAAAKALYGTEDANHPGVATFKKMHATFVGGETHRIRMVDLDISKYEVTPEMAREIFSVRGWRRVVGFQTRNVPHRAHEYLQRIALEHVDGLFIQPLLGQKRVGDYTAEAIMRGYQALLRNYFPEKRVLLGSLSTYMRYAGPREAVFHAIIRRNYGCTHFIVGRDHAGVGNYYQKYEAQSLVSGLSKELGIEIFDLSGPYFCRICDGIATERTCRHAEDPTAIGEISGTDMRAVFKEGKSPDPQYMRPEVVRALDGVQVFIEENEE